MNVQVEFWPGDGEGEVDIEVVLSQRNLASLLAKLEGAPADSKATILKKGILKTGTKGETTWNLIVRAEPDSSHYPEGTPPGEMHPETEKLVTMLRPGWSKRALD